MRSFVDGDKIGDRRKPARTQRDVRHGVEKLVRLADEDPYKTPRAR